MTAYAEGTTDVRDESWTLVLRIYRPEWAEEMTTPVGTYATEAEALASVAESRSAYLGHHPRHRIVGAYLTGSIHRTIADAE